MKILVTIKKTDIATRFDLAMEVLIASSENDHLLTPFRTVLLPRPSAEDLCSFIMKENIEVVICGGIEEKHLKYLTWKKIKVVDSVVGPYLEALELLVEDQLMPGEILPGAVVKG
jgi:predicted Fe-Mo cluster-binding NifX family protein